MLKEKLNTSVRCTVYGLSAFLPFVAGTITSYASDDGTTVTALTTACTTMAGSITSAINGVIPIALPLVGLSLVVTIGLKVFKRITGKA